MPQAHSSYVALFYDIIDADPSSYEEASEKKEWKEAMIEEYQLIMENDVQDVVSRPEGKFVVSYTWIYNIKHATDGKIKKYKARFVVSLRKRE